MKKVLALVLALTMVLGFAATASAYWTNVEYNLFKTDPAHITYTVDGEHGYDYDVEGNKEYTVKAEFTSNDLNNFFGASDTTYDVLSDEYEVLQAIDAYYSLGSKDWYAQRSGNAADDATGAHNLYSANNDLYDAVDDIIANPHDNSVIYKALLTAVGTGTFEDGYESNAFARARRDVENEWYNTYGNNSYFGYQDGFGVTATSSDSTYATVTSQPTIKATREGGVTNYEVSFKVRFTNTTFRTADVDIDVTYRAGGSVQVAQYFYEDTLSFTVFQAQYRTFTEQDALIAFGVTPNVEISADDYAYISADAFRLMLQNSSRSITVVSGMGDSKVRFDKDSTNLPQDVFVGNFTTSANSDSVSINGFSSTTSAKIKIAVGRNFYNANNGKVISVYDANGNKLDVEATLQGDYTVNFYAPLSNYTVAGADWAGQTVPDAGKTNPSMGGAF